MLSTNLGEINVLLNNRNCKYRLIKLTNKKKNFIVDGRCKIVVDISENLNEEIEIQCNLKTDIINKRLIESGEGLASMSFISGKEIVSIGTEDDLEGIICEYLADGFKINVKKDFSVKEIIFGVSWKKMNDVETEELYTWFASDPTLFVPIDECLEPLSKLE